MGEDKWGGADAVATHWKYIEGGGRPGAFLLILFLRVFLVFPLGMCVYVCLSLSLYEKAACILEMVTTKEVQAT